jgi:hypothetical protein
MKKSEAIIMAIAVSLVVFLVYADYKLNEKIQHTMNETPMDIQLYRRLSDQVNRLSLRVSRIEVLLPDEVLFGRERSFTGEAINLEEHKR